MNFLLWIGNLKKLLFPRRGNTIRKPAEGRKPLMELLEDRLTPAAPTLLSIARSSPSQAQTNASAVTFAVTFSEPVTGVDQSDFQIVTTGSLISNPLQVSGSGASYNVTINGIGGNGSIAVKLLRDGSI